VTGDGPKAIFADAVGWLRDRDVLLPGVSRLARLVARERDAATQRLWDSLYGDREKPWEVRRRRPFAVLSWCECHGHRPHGLDAWVLQAPASDRHSL
jgi:hypothetical protein